MEVEFAIVGLATVCVVLAIGLHRAIVRIEQLESRVGKLDSDLFERSRKIVDIVECGTQTARKVDELNRRFELASMVLSGDYEERDRVEPDNE